MKSIIKLLYIFIIISGLFILIFKLTGQTVETLFSQEKCMTWFNASRGKAWAIGIGLLMIDLFLPIPASGIMATLGAVYGTVLGTLISLTGSMLAGLTAFGLAKSFGQKGSRWIASPQEIKQFKDLFDRFGAYAVIFSRALPVMPEVIALLAGFSNMRFHLFIFSLFAGCMPVSFIFSWMGAFSKETPIWGILAAICIPVLIWPVFIKRVRI